MTLVKWSRSINMSYKNAMNVYMCPGCSTKCFYDTNLEEILYIS